MAHSLRSKSKLKSKSIKRGKEFQAAVDLRTQRLAEKAKLDLLKQKKAAAGEKTEGDADSMAVDDEASVANPDVVLKKVSTSGTRGSRHQAIKMKKGKKNMHMNFKIKGKK